MPSPRYAVFAAQDAYQRIVTEALASPNYETGGLLIGRKFDMTDASILVIVAASGPGPAADCQMLSYAPDLAAHQAELERWCSKFVAYDVDYAGEWHTHPNGMHLPSAADVRQTLDILDNPSYYLPDGLLAPIVIFEDNICLLHCYYYARDKRQPELVEFVMIDNVVTLLDELASHQRH